MITREELHESTPVPAELRATVLRVGGTNIYDEPLFRLCLAEDRFVKAAGEWTIWPAHLAVKDRGGFPIQEMQQLIVEQQECLENLARLNYSSDDIAKVGMLQKRELESMFDSTLSTQPLRVESGMKEVPLYGMTGWILEKWKPAEAFGSPQEWYAFRFHGEAALGPYPLAGDYEMVSGPTPYLPSSSQVEEAIRRNFHEIDHRPASPAQRVRDMLNRVEVARQQESARVKSEAKAFLGDAPGSLYKTVSLGAGRVRNELAKAAGITEHVGN